MTLEADLSLSLGTLSLDVSLEVGEETVAVLGPNGAGKSTLLRALAGLVAIERGHVRLDGEMLDSPEEGVFVPPERRPVGMVFQDYLLFPFLTVRDNVAFGLRSRRVPRRQARQRADEWLARMGLEDRAASRPSELSGGQAQRVALARALATEPRLLLLDEPLAALDAGARLEIRDELRSRLTGYRGGRLLVTHDVVDAATLCNRLIVLEGGRIVQQGTIEEISQRPQSRYVADLVGLNFYRGTARDGVVAIAGDTAEVRIADHQAAGPVHISVHPRAVTLQSTSLPVSARNQWAGVVRSVDRLGDRVRVRVDGPLSVVAEVTPDALERLQLDLGSPVVAAVKATEVEVYAAS